MWISEIKRVARVFAMLWLGQCALLPASDVNRRHLGEVTWGPTDRLEYLRGEVGEATTYFAVVDFGGCHNLEDLARGMVRRVIEEEAQAGVVAKYEVACVEVESGYRTVAVLQSLAGAQMTHWIFLYLLPPEGGADVAEPLGSCGEGTYGFASLDLTTGPSGFGFVLLNGRAYTGERVYRAFSDSCEQVGAGDVREYRAIGEGPARGVLILEPVLETNPTINALAIRRFTDTNEVLERLCYREGEPEEDVRQLGMRLREALKRMDLSTPALWEDEPTGDAGSSSQCTLEEEVRIDD